MHTALHAFGWALPRLGITLGVLVFVPLFAYAILVLLTVIGQAAASFGQSG
jgi:hypothetical protein